MKIMKTSIDDFRIIWDFNYKYSSLHQHLERMDQLLLAQINHHIQKVTLILISGEIKYIALGDQLSLIIQAPNGNIVQLDQMTVGSDKKFSAEINPNGPYWKNTRNV